MLLDQLRTFGQIAVLRVRARPTKGSPRRSKWSRGRGEDGHGRRKVAGSSRRRLRLRHRHRSRGRRPGRDERRRTGGPRSQMSRCPSDCASPPLPQPAHSRTAPRGLRRRRGAPPTSGSPMGGVPIQWPPGGLHGPPGRLAGRDRSRPCGCSSSGPRPRRPDEWARELPGETSSRARHDPLVRVIDYWTGLRAGGRGPLFEETSTPCLASETPSPRGTRAPTAGPRVPRRANEHRTAGTGPIVFAPGLRARLPLSAVPRRGRGDSRDAGRPARVPRPARTAVRTRTSATSSAAATRRTSGSPHRRGGAGPPEDIQVESFGQIWTWKEGLLSQYARRLAGSRATRRSPPLPALDGRSKGDC